MRNRRKAKKLSLVSLISPVSHSPFSVFAEIASLYYFAVGSLNNTSSNCALFLTSLNFRVDELNASKYEVRTMNGTLIPSTSR